MTTREAPLDALFVTSAGGHLAEVLEWLPSFRGASWRVVVNSDALVPEDVAPRTLRMTHAERDWRVAWNFVEAWRILSRLRPRFVASPGAGCAVPFAVLCRLRSIPYVHVEPRSAVRVPTLAGRIARRFARRTIVQWPDLLPSYPRAECVPTFPASSS